MVLKLNEISACYLCGKRLEICVNDDHVPPKQFFPKSLRRSHNLNLLTLPVHELCNSSFKLDEEYFVHSLGILSYSSYAGAKLLANISEKYKAGERIKLGRKILKEFDERPGGLTLPINLVAKRIDTKRVNRIIWKIVRGLYFYNASAILPENTPKKISLVPPGYKPSIAFQSLNNSKNLGKYPGIFDYRYKQFSDPDMDNFNYWAFLFWNRIIVEIAFHHPECKCEKCLHERENP